MHLAERSLFLAISRILWAFKISPVTEKDPVDGSLHEVLPNTDNVLEGLISWPADFPALIESRSEAREHLLKNAWILVKADLLEKENGEYLSKPLNKM
jgi:hypothetical protein